jgi:hypothetical protein
MAPVAIAPARIVRAPTEIAAKLMEILYLASMTPSPRTKRRLYEMIVAMIAPRDSYRGMRKKLREKCRTADPAVK